MPELSSFNPIKQLPKHFVMLAIGRRKSGKTTAIMSIMNDMRTRYDFALIFCGSLATCEDYRRVVPASFVHESFKSGIVEELVSRQEDRRRNKKRVEDVLIILDDLAFNTSIFKTRVIRQLFFNGRHLNCTLVISSQTALSIDPGLRGNTDIVLCAGEKNSVYRKRIFESYSICFSSLKAFDDAYIAMTNNFGLLVLYASGSTSYKLEDNVFQYRAAFPLPRFRMNPRGRWWRLKAPSSEQQGVYRVAHKRPITDEKSFTTTVRVVKTKKQAASRLF